ncbi:PDR/VanB family oxidoreductase [Gynuella sunshinyii]|uniref:Flavodoxin reductase (Ferredoxin-NADPH reductase) family 1 n=1 Tax=Gynuella sunshinyii YC6258 TaxID=1445510 RepID=A0A0C5VZU4_9GAMM|nr:PDR/VanB family oxidoreductase [Gynuella sunshinyii]AJQ95949.1 flavodoxin reductase (ferredoxin-NADPH reductase) family 1 [Gynuella sunshinyii YC6258]
MLDVKVTRKTYETDDIVSLELMKPDGSSLPSFTAGAHIDLHLPDNMIRQYSLFNSSTETDRYMIGVLKDPSSRGGSLAVHDHIKEGDIVQISEPRNLFALEQGARRSILFAGGIGVTPILAMAEQLVRTNAEFEMHYCARSKQRMAFMEHIANSAFASNVQCHFDDGDEAQRLNIDQVLATPEPGTHIYVCGPTGFMDYVLTAAETLGWSAAQIHREYFSAAPVDHSQDGAFEVEINSTGQVFVIPADQSVLSVLEEAGVDIPMACEEGVCGTCLTRVLEGEPEHRDVFMSDEEHALNNQFTPCCSRARSARLLLDL